jgi:small subunit ribosomal protein S16
MKTKIKLRNMGCRNRPYWKIIVQGDKKKLTGKYIEEVGYWQPRAGAVVKRGIAINKHKLRYWLSVGA